MLAMTEGCVASHDLLWPDGDDTWPWSASGEEGHAKKMVEINKPQDEPQKMAEVDEDLEKSLPPSSKGKKRSATARNDGTKNGKTKKGGGGGDSDHELHIWTERERRKKMKNMFQGLLDLLPHVSPKADKSTIVEEGVKYIKELQGTLTTLERQKFERIHGVPSREAFLADQASASSSPNPLFQGPTAFKTWTSPNVTVNISGRDAQICVCGPHKPTLLTAICFVLEKYKLEVVSAQVSSDRNRCMYMIHTNANYGASDPLLSSVFPVEEIYKQAAAEIMLWVN